MRAICTWFYSISVYGTRPTENERDALREREVNALFLVLCWLQLLYTLLINHKCSARDTKRPLCSLLPLIHVNIKLSKDMIHLIIHWQAAIVFKLNNYMLFYSKLLINPWNQFNKVNAESSRYCWVLHNGNEWGNYYNEVGWRRQIKEVLLARSIFKTDN